ncbi:unnamed protein product [Acanthoscelides obtectus]|uniref:Uncharacterized protein n=1 Tax=Acanthoscelides obtectus TaxID=200917 RepID=A0A9P0JQ30_ACAOB|nr:unnamed protein product [Acanthoscelides obtectus]CAK1625840.1 hypothetical protein AOBTE_LOCUS3438 [Acanthoscelides obtectus]
MENLLWEIRHKVDHALRTSAGFHLNEQPDSAERLLGAESVLDEAAVGQSDLEAGFGGRRLGGGGCSRRGAMRVVL